MKKNFKKNCKFNLLVINFNKINSIFNKVINYED